MTETSHLCALLLCVQERLQLAIAESAAEAEEEEELGVKRKRPAEVEEDDDDDVVDIGEADGEEEEVEAFVISDDEEEEEEERGSGSSTSPQQRPPSGRAGAANADASDDGRAEALVHDVHPSEAVEDEEEEEDADDAVLRVSGALPSGAPIPAAEEPQPQPPTQPAPSVGADHDGAAAVSLSGVSLDASRPPPSAVPSALLLPSPPSSEPAAGPGVTRLQLRFPSGAVLQRRFRLLDSAAALHDIIQARWKEEEERMRGQGKEGQPGRVSTFHVLSLHPRRCIDLLQHAHDSLASLQLTNASLIVQPASSTSH